MSQSGNHPPPPTHEASAALIRKALRIREILIIKANSNSISPVSLPHLCTKYRPTRYERREDRSEKRVLLVGGGGCDAVVVREREREIERARER